MLPASRERILDRLADNDLVLDVGGWADPFWRADWVIDLLPYETRGLYEREGWSTHGDEPAERFNANTWVRRDVCDREPLPFDDNAFDFVICSQTLEDLRDPIWVCSEIARIGRAGYIEVPSRTEEQCWGLLGGYVGWPHHRWFVDVGTSAIEFVQKLHSIHIEPEHYFPLGFAQLLSAEERVQTMWWERGFECEERVLHDDEEVDRYLRPVIERGLAAHPETPVPPPMPRRRLRRLGRR